MKRIHFRDPHPARINLTSEKVVATALTESKIDCLIAEKVNLYTKNNPPLRIFIFTIFAHATLAEPLSLSIASIAFVDYCQFFNSWNCRCLVFMLKCSSVKDLKTSIGMWADEASIHSELSFTLLASKCSPTPFWLRAMLLHAVWTFLWSIMWSTIKCHEHQR